MPAARSIMRDAQNGAAERDAGDDEQCPVCQSRKYLNKNMKFLISTECYHKMCESCVDRLLQRGPRPCPISGCKATIRRHKFRAPTFADLKLEKEVDIRREMAKTFNQREEDFESLLAYNDHLNMVEDFIFNIVNGIDTEATYAKIEQFRRDHLRAIEQNKELEEEGAIAFKAAQKAQEEAATAKRKAAVEEQEREKQELQMIEQEYLTKLTAGGDAEELAYERTLKLQKAADRHKAAVDALSSGTNTSLLKGFKRRGEHKEVPYDPFGGLSDHKDYFVVCPDYSLDTTFSDRQRTQHMLPGGFAKEDFYRRALIDAFAGLGVHVEEEVGSRGDDMGSEVAIAAEEMVAT